MRHRRIYETIGLRYADLDKMSDLLADIRTMLATHPGIDQKETILVNFTAYGSYSVDFFIHCYSVTTDWARFSAIKEDVLFQIGTLIHHHGADFAFPTSTVLLANTVSPFINKEASSARATES